MGWNLSTLRSVNKWAPSQTAIRFPVDRNQWWMLDPKIVVIPLFWLVIGIPTYWIMMDYDHVW